ncbi:MAG: hypothetical protein K2I08_08455 [Muribaculaceae bacterium]|nr:hypothetical protein [Muribaculaceae bacterium]MDE6522148.1 hypothetical protein [Muribaculaceae bacterium]
MEENLTEKDENGLSVISSDEIYALLTNYIREVFARRRYARVHVCPTKGIDGKLIGFYNGEFEVDDYVFRICGHKLRVEKNCKIIGECDTNAELIGWLFILLNYVIDQCHVKELKRIYINFEL